NPVFSRIGLNRSNPAGSIRSITTDSIGAIRKTDPRNARPYLDMESSLGTGTNLYFEATLRGLDAGTRLRYRVVVYPVDGLATRTPQYTIHLTQPTFGYEDIRFIGPVEDTAVNTNVVYYTADADFHHLRVDYLDISGGRPDFQLRINNNYNVSLG